MPVLAPHRRRWRQFTGSAIAVIAIAGPFAVRTVSGVEVYGTARARLGGATAAVIAPHFVAETRLHGLPAALTTAPIIGLPGFVSIPSAGSGSADTAPGAAAMIYAVDDRFWRLNRADGIHGPATDEIILSPALAATLAVTSGIEVTVTISPADVIPRASAHGSGTRPGEALRRRVSPQSLAGRPALSPLDTSRDLPAAFVSLAQVQRADAWSGRANAILISGDNATAAAQAAIDDDILDDYGLSLREDTSAQVVAIETRAGQLVDAVSDAAVRAALDVGGLPTPVLTTLANRITAGDRTINYPFVAGLELQALSPEIHGEERSHPPLVLNQRAAERLGVSPGALVGVEYPVWRSDGRLDVDLGAFEIVAVVPIAGLAAAPALTPALPGIAGSAAMTDWRPRVPFDPARVEAADAAYWRAHTTVPQAFVPLDVARANWGSARSAATSVVVSPADGVPLTATRERLDAALRRRLTPPMAGVQVRDLAGEWRMRADSTGAGWLRLSLWSLPLACAGLLLALQPVLATRASRYGAGAAATAAGLAMAMLLRQPGPSDDDGVRELGGGYASIVETTLPAAVPATPGVTRIRIHDLAFEDGVGPPGPPLRIAAVDDRFIEEARFRFAGSLERSDEERANPWMLLHREQRDRSDPAAGALTPILPVAATARTLARLDRVLGDDLPFVVRGHDVRLRVVAVLADSGLFADTLLMADSPFFEWFSASGYQWLGVDGSSPDVQSLVRRLTDDLAKAGPTVTDVAVATAPWRRAASRDFFMRLGLAASAFALAFASLLRPARRNS